MQSDLGAVQKLGEVAIHMGELAALLAGVEPGARRFEASLA